MKVHYLSPLICFSKDKAPFHKLPLNLLQENKDKDVLKNQWNKLQAICIESICSDEKIESLDILDFWLKVEAMKMP